MKFSISVATGLVRWLLKTFGIAAITAPWRTIYVLKEFQYRDDIMRHEIVHVEQIARDGPVKFSILYLYWLVRYGYRANPYEIEAYAKEPIGD